MIDLTPFAKLAGQACFIALMIAGTVGIICFIYQELVRR